VGESFAARALPAHGGQLSAISEAFSVPIDGLLDFSASIYPDGPSPRVIEAVSDALRSPQHLRQYPDLKSSDLRAGLARHTAIPADNILVANGVVPLMSATLRAIQARKCLLPVPAFGEYRRILEREKIEIHTYPLVPSANFRPDLDQLIGSCVEHGCDTLILNNPHNPSGVTVDASEIRLMITHADRHGIRVLLDEAFIDFVPEESVSADVPQSGNLIVFRSVSKFFAMAGLRVAYVIASQHRVPAIATLLDPWSVSTLASQAAGAAVKDLRYISNTIRRNSEERERLTRALTGIGLTVFPACANFVMLRFPIEHAGENVWEQLILDHGIVLRNCGTFEGLDGRYMRAAVRGRDDNQRLVHALASVLNRNAPNLGINS